MYLPTLWDLEASGSLAYIIFTATASPNGPTPQSFLEAYHSWACNQCKLSLDQTLFFSVCTIAIENLGDSLNSWPLC